MANIPGNTEKVKALLEHSAFDIKNPNKVYSLLGGFCGSYVNFHHKDGSGYDLLGDLVVKLDAINPQVPLRICHCSVPSTPSVATSCVFITPWLGGVIPSEVRRPSRRRMRRRMASNECCSALLGRLAISRNTSRGRMRRWRGTYRARTVQVAARMVKPFTRWAKYDTGRQETMKKQLSKILAAPSVSENTFEIASKSLEA
eukprot:1177225-Prorocentrum_minimum.AAC.2